MLEITVLKLFIPLFFHQQEFGFVWVEGSALAVWIRTFLSSLTADVTFVVHVAEGSVWSSPNQRLRPSLCLPSQVLEPLKIFLLLAISIYCLYLGDSVIFSHLITLIRILEIGRNLHILFLDYVRLLSEATIISWFRAKPRRWRYFIWYWYHGKRLWDLIYFVLLYLLNRMVRAMKCTHSAIFVIMTQRLVLVTWSPRHELSGPMHALIFYNISLDNFFIFFL